MLCFTIYGCGGHLGHVTRYSKSMVSMRVDTALRSSYGDLV